MLSKASDLDRSFGMTQEQKMDMDQIQDEDMWQALANTVITVMNFHGTIQCREFLS